MINRKRLELATIAVRHARGGCGPCIQTSTGGCYCASLALAVLEAVQRAPPVQPVAAKQARVIRPARAQR